MLSSLAPSLMCLCNLMSLTATLFLWTLWLGWMWRSSTSASDLFRSFFFGGYLLPTFSFLLKLFLMLCSHHQRILFQNPEETIETPRGLPIHTALFTSPLVRSFFLFFVIFEALNFKADSGCFQQKFHIITPSTHFFGRVETKDILFGPDTKAETCLQGTASKTQCCEAKAKEIQDRQV